MSQQRPPIRIVIVHRDALSRDLLRIALDRSNGITVAGVFDDAEALLAESAALAPDVAIIDIDVPGQNGIQLATKLRRIVPGVGIVLLVDERDLNLLSSADALQRTSYLVNTCVNGFTTLRRAIQVTHARLLDLDDVEPIAGVQRSPRSALPGFTPRQHEILDLVTRGLTNKAIAMALHLKEKTIENQLATIYGKFQFDGGRGTVHPRVRAAMRFIEVRERG
ncbi:response regulator transcription factor [soil metagenome]